MTFVGFILQSMLIAEWDRFKKNIVFSNNLITIFDSFMVAFCFHSETDTALIICLIATGYQTEEMDCLWLQ